MCFLKVFLCFQRDLRDQEQTVVEDVDVEEAEEVNGVEEEEGDVAVVVSTLVDLTLRILDLITTTKVDLMTTTTRQDTEEDLEGTSLKLKLMDLVEDSVAVLEVVTMMKIAEVAEVDSKDVDVGEEEGEGVAEEGIVNLTDVVVVIKGLQNLEGYCCSQLKLQHCK